MKYFGGLQDRELDNYSSLYLFDNTLSLLLLSPIIINLLKYFF